MAGPRTQARGMVLSPRGALATTTATAFVARMRSTFRGAPKLSLVLLALAIFLAIFANLVAPHDPIEVSGAKRLLQPGWGENLLGTDHMGRDILSRAIYGARISVTVGFLAVFVSGIVGTTVALLSAVFKGWVDTVLMRVTDAFLALPYLMVAVTVVSLLGPSLRNVILVIGLMRFMAYARVLRGEALKAMEMDYIRLARVAGAGRVRIMVRHVFPNLMNSLLVLATLELGSAVVAEAALSFLGLGVPRPQPSWGTMLAESQVYIYTAWWLPMIPGFAITLLVMSSNLTGDWLRDRTDPVRRQL